MPGMSGEEDPVLGDSFSMHKLQDARYSLLLSEAKKTTDDAVPAGAGRRAEF